MMSSMGGTVPLKLRRLRDLGEDDDGTNPFRSRTEKDAKDGRFLNLWNVVDVTFDISLFCIISSLSSALSLLSALSGDSHNITRLRLMLNLRRSCNFVISSSSLLSPGLV